MTTTESSVLPVPADFPVEWDDPADEQLFWFQDNLHFPLPQTPLNSTMFQPAFAIGPSRAIPAPPMPLQGLRPGIQRRYHPLPPVSPRGTPPRRRRSRLVPAAGDPRTKGCMRALPSGETDAA